MTYNRICNNCGTKYYACSNCIKKNSWKNFCCSRECYRAMIAKREENSPIELEGGNGMTVLRAGLTSGLTISITGYDLELGKFDCTDGKTRTIDEFDYFIVPVDEMKNLSERLYDKVEKPKKINKKNEVAEPETQDE